MEIECTGCPVCLDLKLKQGVLKQLRGFPDVYDMTCLGH